MPAPHVVDRFELVALKDLTPNPRNANTHPEEQIAELAGMFRQFGFLVPIVAKADGTILAGHGRFLAAHRAGLEKVSVVRAEHLDDVNARAFMIADNRAPRLAKVDTDMLKLELSDLESHGVDLPGLGYSEADLADMFPDENAAAGGGGGGGDAYKNQYAVVVVCEHETHQQEVYDKLRAEGFNCKVVVT